MDTKDGVIINITIHGWILALVGLIVLLVIVAFSSSTARGAESQVRVEESSISAPESEVMSVSSGTGRRFYVTYSRYYSNEVLTACASGYHTASMWELYDVSNLVYAHDQPNASSWADSGFGPPSQWNGWIRTGYISSIENTQGKGNCANWSSISASAYGSVIRLSNNWNTPPNIGSWTVTTQSCNYDLYVWCVED